VSELSPGVVAVVDDDDGMRRALQRVLETAGFTVETFGSAEALLATGAASRARCIVLDVHLPGMSGFALQTRLESMGTRIPVVFITGLDSASSRRQAAAAASDYLVKPFLPEALVAAVDRMLQREE
jgi:FixJ family two-component response regulator